MKYIIIASAVLLFQACDTNKKTDTDTKENTTKQSDNIRNENSIVGVWRPTEIDGKMSEEERKELYAKASIEFTASGNYISVFDDKRETGTYTFDQKAMTLVTVQEPDKNEERFKAEWLDGKLKLTTEDASMILERK